MKKKILVGLRRRPLARSESCIFLLIISFLFIYFSLGILSRSIDGFSHIKKNNINILCNLFIFIV